MSRLELVAFAVTIAAQVAVTVAACWWIRDGGCAR